jgi:hypothetical protein
MLLNISWSDDKLIQRSINIRNVHMYGIFFHHHLLLSWTWKFMSFSLSMLGFIPSTVVSEWGGAVVSLFSSQNASLWCHWREREGTVPYMQRPWYEEVQEKRTYINFLQYPEDPICSNSVWGQLQFACCSGSRPAQVALIFSTPGWTGSRQQWSGYL